MKTSKLFLLVVFFLNAQLFFAQNYVTYSNLSQTVSTNSGTEVSVTVVASCYGSSQNSILITPTYCVFDSGLTSISYSNGTYLLPGQNSTITFKFKKTVSVNSSFTYKFSTNFSCSQPDSSQIKITVNYLNVIAPTCNLPFPPNFNISAIQSNSIKYNWDFVSGASSYVIGYTNNWPNWNYITLSNSQNSYLLNGLLPSTSYMVFVAAVCSNGVSGSTGYGSNPLTGSVTTITTLCSPKVPATNLNALLWGGAWTISFTPASNVSLYTMEYFDLVNNNGGVTQITYSSTPNNYSNFFYNVPTNHNFKFRFLQGCGGDSEWKNIDISSCSIILPTGLFVNNSDNNVSFNWSTITNSQNYQGEYIIYNLAGQQISGTFTSMINTYSTTTNTSTILGNKFVKFRVKSQCANGDWSDFSPYSNTTVWN